MKLVDQNGKLFKKINIIDAIVILLVLIVIAAFGWKLVSARASAAQEDRMATEQAYEESDHLLYKVICADVPKEIAESFQAQMQLPQADRQLMNGGVAVDGYITEVNIIDDGASCTVYFTMEAVLIEKEGIYSVGTQEVRLGKTYIVKTYQIETEGSVYSMEVKKNG